MNISIKNQQTSFTRKVLSAFTAFSFIFSLVMSPGPSYSQTGAQSVFNLPIPGLMVVQTNGFNPAIIKGFTIHTDNALEFDFIVSAGDDRLEGEIFEEESKKLIKYFLAALTTPEEEMWVNLSPYEQDRVIPKSFGDTEMGRDMLAQDYLLKQLTASMMYPEDELGKKFWDRVYTKAFEQYGTTEIPINTFNKIWIVPERAGVYVRGTSVFVVDSHLKIMLEEDYKALNENKGNEKYGLDSLDQEDVEIVSSISSEVVKEILLPEIEKEVNEGEIFANLRQIYNSSILAAWYKKNLRKSLLGKVYVDQSKNKGIDTEDKQINQKIYDQYVEAFNKGVYNYIKEDYDINTDQVIPRKYFSGGLEIGQVTPVLRQWGEFDNSSSPITIDDLPIDVQNSFLLNSDQEVKNVSIALVERPVASSAIFEITEERKALAQSMANTMLILQVDLKKGKKSFSSRGLEPKQALGIETLEFFDAIRFEIGSNKERFYSIKNKIFLENIAQGKFPVVFKTMWTKDGQRLHSDKFGVDLYGVDHKRSFLKGETSPHFFQIYETIDGRVDFKFEVDGQYQIIKNIESVVDSGDRSLKVYVKGSEKFFIIYSKGSVVKSSKSTAASPIISQWAAGDQEFSSFRSTEKKGYGGINFNSNLIDWQIKRDGDGVPLPVWDQPIEAMRIEGFLPIILNITPVFLPMLMGFVNVCPDEGAAGCSNNVDLLFKQTEEKVFSSEAQQPFGVEGV